jgi:hypothetical protein
MRYATKQRVAVLATMISVLLVAGVAFAAWTSTATGDGSATAFDHTETFEGLVTKTAGSDLYPGASSDVVVTVTNDQDYPVTVDSISAGDSEALTGCAEASVTTVSTTPGDVIDAGLSKDFTLVATMDDQAAEACAGQTFTIPVEATLSSN